jgi:hypothetical protein
MRHGLTVVASLFLLPLLTVAGTSSCALASDAHPPLPDERLGVRTAPLLLLSRPDVRADLGLTAKQAEEAEKEITALYVRADALRGKTGVQALEQRKVIDEAQRVWFEINLTAEQRKRLLQIDLQWEGPSSLVSRPVVADTLGLSPEQRTTLKVAVAKRDQARLQRTYKPADEQTLTRHALVVLTPSQKDLWRAMLGTPFVFVPQIAASSKAQAKRE